MIDNSNLKTISTYIKYEKYLNKIEALHKKLKSPVKSSDRKKRTKILLRIRNKGKKILLNANERIPKKMISKVESIVKKSDKLKRENCILQGVGPFYVIKPGDLSIFKERSENNIIELRKYYGVHRKSYYDDALSVSMAFTLPGLFQKFHSHERMNELTMVLSGNIIAKGKTSTGLKTLSVYPGDVFMAKPYTIHTLINKNSYMGLNATVKVPIGYGDRKEFKKIPKANNGYINVMRLKKKKERWGYIKCFTWKEKSFKYRVDFISINPLSSLESMSDKDLFIFNITGSLTISVNGNSRKVSKGSLIYIRKNFKYVINNFSKKNEANLYSVCDLKS